MFKKMLTYLSEHGVWVPLANDIQTGEKSFRLWTASVSFHLSALSVVALHFWPVSTATWTSIAFFGLCMVFYTFKKLTSAKIDLKGGELELSDKSEEKLDKPE